MRPHLEKLVRFGIKLLQTIPQDCEVGLAYSGGKDSDVILQLARESGIKFFPLYKNTTIDPPGTIAHVRAQGVPIHKPKMSFFQLIEYVGLPSRWRRYCCSYLKEYYTSPRTIIGIRRSESTKRAARYKEPEYCRVWKKDQRERIYLPILEWTDEDVEDFIKDRGIQCAPVYYDENGKFHVERRLGCIGCPLQSQRKRREEFKKYPKMLVQWIKHYQIYLDTHKTVKAYEYSNGCVTNRMFFELFCDMSKGRFSFDDQINGGLFPEQSIDPKAYMEDYFKIKL